jgi:hypothetical protein
MLERRIRAVSFGAVLAKGRKDPLRLFVQCFSAQFEELDRSKTPGLVHELSSLGSYGSTSGPWKSGNRAVPSPTPPAAALVLLVRNYPDTFDRLERVAVH